MMGTFKEKLIDNQKLSGNSWIKIYAINSFK